MFLHKRCFRIALEIKKEFKKPSLSLVLESNIIDISLIKKPFYNLKKLIAYLINLFFKFIKVCKENNFFVAIIFEALFISMVIYTIFFFFSP
jgi:hypothetical protein